MKKRKKKHSRVGDFLSPLLKDIDEWCRGRLYLPRACLLIFFAYIAICHIGDPQYQDCFKALNLCIHEMGHYLFAPFGEFINVLGGSLFQCLVPIISMLMFLRQRDYFAIAVSFGWLSTNLYDVALYASDASAMDLPLVSPGATGEVIHDWNFILDKLGLLRYDQMIAQLIRLDATMCMLICLAFGAWLCLTMQKLKSKPHET
jgi:hypothetical protein